MGRLTRKWLQVISGVYIGRVPVLPERVLFFVLFFWKLGFQNFIKYFSVHLLLRYFFHAQQHIQEVNAILSVDIF